MTCFQDDKSLVFNDHPQDLLSFANESRKSGLFTDIDIQVGSKQFPCNKMVLSCYSEYFASMFQQETQGKCQSTVQLEDLEEQHVKILVDYIYGEPVEINDDNVFQILAAADYLKIQKMKTICFDYFKNGLNVENCLNVLSASIRYMPALSTDWIYEFISKNFAAVIKLDRFKLLSTSDLASLLEHLRRMKLNNELLYTAIIDWVASHRKKRKFDFASLFQLIDLSQLSRQYLIDIVSKEQLVKENADCLNAVVSEFSTNTRPSFRRRDSYLENNLSKIIILGGNSKYSVMAMRVVGADSTSVSQLSTLPMTLVRQSSNKVKNLILCIGGTVEGTVSNYCTSKVYQMDLTDENTEWKEVSYMNERRSDHSSALFEDNIIVSGGQRSNTPLKSVECYCILTNKWTVNKASMNLCRSGHAMVVCNNRLYALGGASAKYDQSLLSSVETLSHVNEAWETGPSMNKARCQFAAVSFNGEIYAIGGQSENGIEKSVEIFSPAQRKWSFIKSLNRARKGHAACVFDGKIFVIGGVNENKQTDELTFETYDPDNDTWMLGELPRILLDKLYGHSLVVV